MIKKIYHISDIHCRLYNRHDEYRLIFDKLFSKIDELGADDAMIVITGDVAHAKTDLTPEFVILVGAFLKKCADTCPTILIPGNHDFVESNKQRVDVLTPIVKLLNHPRLYYSLYSEIIDIGDVSISHFSIWDSSDTWKYASELRGIYKIALYHGPVEGASTDSGFEKFTNSLPLNIFDGFDIVLLGDIHKYQVFGSGNIAYPSSLIQQDFGESSDGHGFIMWDIQSSTHRFIQLDNEFSLHTINVINGEVVGIIPKFSDKSAVRLIVENTQKSKVSEIVDGLISKYGEIKVSISNKKLDTKDGTLSDSQVDAAIVGWNVESHIPLFREYFKNSGKEISRESFEKIISIHRDISARYTDNDVNEGSTWNPISFEFSNMFSYGENVKIDFSDMAGLVGLLAANRSGKTNLIDSLTYICHDKCTRTSSGVHVMNINASSFIGKFVFSIGNDVYSITRIGKRETKGNVSVKVSFIRHDVDGDFILNGKDRDSTNKIIRKYIGTYDDFVMTTLNTMTDPRSLIDMTQKERKEFLYKFIDINRFGEQSDICKKESEVLNITLKQLDKINYDVEIEDINSKIEINDGELNFLNNAVDNIQRGIDEIISKIDLIEITTIVDNIDIVEIENNILKELSKSKDIGIELIELDSQWKSILDDKSNAERSIVGVEISNLKNEKNELVSKLDAMKIVGDSIRDIEFEIANLKSKVDTLKTHEYDPNCQYCVQSKFVSDAILAKSKLFEKESELINLREKYSRDVYEKAIIDVNNIEREILSYNDFIIKIGEYESKLSLCEAKIGMHKSKLVDINLELDRLGGRKSKYYENVEIIKRNQEMIRIKSDLIAERNTLQFKMKDLESQRINIVANKTIFIDRMKSLQDGKEKRISAGNDYYAYENYIQATGRDGIPYLILKNIIGIVENEVNNILDECANFKLALEMDGSDINGYILGGTVGLEKWPFELASGMEKFIISTAIRSSLVKLSALPKPNFLIIDEGFGVLDATNLKSVVEVIDKLKEKFKFVLCITHIMEMRDYMFKIINIDKIGGYSVVSTLK